MEKKTKKLLEDNIDIDLISNGKMDMIENIKEDIKRRCENRGH